MLKITCEGTLLSQTLKAINAVCREAVLVADFDGIKVLGIDSANVAFIDLKVSKDEFKEYRLKSESEFGIPVEKLIPLCSAMDKEEFVCLDVGDGRLKLTFGNHEYAIRTLSVKTVRRPQRVPNNLGTERAEFTVPSTILSDIIKSSKIVENCMIVRMIADVNSFRYIIESDDETIRQNYEVKNNQFANALYSLDYLKDFNVGINVDTIDLKFQTDSPLSIDFIFGNGGGSIRYLLAPRM